MSREALAMEDAGAVYVAERSPSRPQVATAVVECVVLVVASLISYGLVTEQSIGTAGRGAPVHPHPRLGTP
jgi:hypothetical protein